MKRLITSLIFSSICIFLAAQPKMPNQCQAFKPKALSSMVLTESAVNRFLKSGGYGQKEAVSEANKTYWVAYSDRENNTTYVAPNSSSAKFSSLDFNEEVRIAKIEGNYALVYTEPMVKITYPMLSSNVKCRGWIPMDKLLLWQTCLANDRNIYNKALLCLNLEEADSKSNSGYGYRNPNKSGTKVPLSTDMNFYFIMKQEGDMFLISKQNRMDGTISSSVLVGWVSKDSFVPWNQRSCLEPTWQVEDVEDFIARKVEVDIFSNPELKGERVSYVGYKKKESEKYDRYLYRMNAADLRYPILDNGTKVVYNMSTFSTMGGAAAGTEAEKTGQQEYDADKEQALKKKMRINIAIVIDGTSSMEPYYPSVKQALQEGCDYFSQNYDIRIGAVIFRDYDDGKAGLVETCNMVGKNNFEKLYKFLDTGGNYGIKSSSKDRTNTEALYHGIDTALDTLRFGEGESNIMLVIGDCGNDLADTKSATSEQIIKKLVEKDIHLMGFQVQNKDDGAYNSFNDQMINFMRESLKQKYIQNIKIQNVRIKANQTKSQDGGPADGWNFNAEGEGINHQFYICNHKFANSTINGGKMNPGDLKNNMITSISGFSATIKNQLDIIMNMSIDEIGFTSNISDADGLVTVSGAYVASVLGYDEEKLEKLKKKNALISFRGYAKRQDVSGRDYFKPVIFISIEELTDLLKRLMKVDEAARQSQTKDRTPYINAMKALVKSLAQGMTDAQMDKLSNGDVTNMIAGLNETADALNSYTLDDIADPQVVDDAKFTRIVMDFQRKYRNLNSIRQNSRYKYIKEFNGAKYYWIPIEDLP